MAAKKERSGVEALRSDVQTLTEAFWTFRDTMITNAAVEQAERQSIGSAKTGSTSASEAQIDDAASLLTALAHPQRLRIAMHLAQQPDSVSSLVEKLGLRTTGAAYHHLNVLTNHGVVVQPVRGTFSLTDHMAADVHRLLGALFDDAVQEKPKTPEKKKKKT